MRVSPRLGSSALGCALALGTVVLTSACPKAKPCNPSTDVACFDGGHFPYICTDATQAFANPQCVLTSGACLNDFISGRDVRQWYGFTTPATVDAKTLLHLHAQYDAGTTVVLEGALLTNPGAMPSGDPIFDIGYGVDLIVPATMSGQQLLFTLNDQFVGHPNAAVDQNNPYTLCATLVEDMDPNGPGVNPITLTPVNGVPTGTATGVLSTRGRVDKFSVAVPSGRQIIYLHITGGCDGGTCFPPPNYLMSYNLLDPQGDLVATDFVPTVLYENDAGLPIDLATARLAAAQGDGGQTPDPGTWEIDVTGLVPNMTPIAGVQADGDLRVTYNMTVEVFPDKDSYEPNDDIATATVNNPVNLASPGSSVMLTNGRLSYVPDQDWYVVHLQAPQPALPTILHYKFTPGTSGGQFPTLSNPPTRELALLNQTPADIATCINDAGVCPEGWDAEPQENQASWQNYAGAACGGSFGVAALCLLADREEDDMAFSPTCRNFEGYITVEPFTTAQTYYLLVRGSSANVNQGSRQQWADDIPYTLQIDWMADPQEAKFYSGGVHTGYVTNIARDPSYNSGVPMPTPNITGQLLAGYSRLSNNSVSVIDQFNMGTYVRGPFDYDAVPSQRDHYELDFSGLSGDQAWELKWDIAEVGGMEPYDLSLEVSFCNAGGCQPAPNPIIYDPGAGQWFNPTGGFGMQHTVWDQANVGGNDEITTSAYGCWCFQGQYIAGGKFYMDVLAVNRTSWAPATYTISTATAPYPQFMPPYMGGYNTTCPNGGDAGTCQM